MALSGFKPVSNGPETLQLIENKSHQSGRGIANLPIGAGTMPAGKLMLPERPRAVQAIVATTHLLN
jgi:hypothetical protein